MDANNWRRWTAAIALGLGGCDAQAGAGYRGEALLRLEGQVTLTADTGGGPINPAFCYAPPITTLGRPQVDADRIKPEEFPSNAWSDLRENAYWFPRAGDYQLVDVESIGTFPADFNVAVYEPPPDVALYPVVSGEPRMGRAWVCAVREGHVRSGALPFSGLAQHCNGDGPCPRQFLEMQRDTRRYWIENYDCPGPIANRSDCTLTTEGDEHVTSDFVADMVGMADDVDVIYLDQPAPAGGITAWLFGRKDRGLSAGFHVFTGYKGEIGSSECDYSAYRRALEMAYQKYADKIHDVPNYGPMVDPEYSAEANEFQLRTTLETRMAECPSPIVEELAVDAPVSVTLAQGSRIFRPEVFVYPKEE